MHEVREEASLDDIINYMAVNRLHQEEDERARSRARVKAKAKGG